MGFTCSPFSLYGLPSVAWYVTIGGAFQIRKAFDGTYILVYTVRYKTASGHPTVTEAIRSLGATELPADLWTMIYTDIKKNLDPFYDTDSQSLEFTDC